MALRPVAMATTREGPMTIFGYARVSPGSQDYQSQVDKLRSAGANKTYRERSAELALTDLSSDA